MKSIFLSLALFLISPFLHACDFCNYYVSINPLLKKNFVGVRYHHSPYSLNDATSASLKSKNINPDKYRELKSVYELHGQFYPLKKLQVLVSVPYMVNTEKSAVVKSASNERVTHEGHDHHGGVATGYEWNTISGVGDPAVLANYNILTRNSTDSIAVTHSLFAGGGVKFPAGKYKISESENPHQRLHMPGTGSVDFMLNATYILKVKRAGLSFNTNYLFTGENSQHYKFGERLNSKATLFYEIRKGSLYVFPGVGPYLESANKDKLHDADMVNTGGTIISTQASLDIYYKSFSWHTEFQLPVKQQLNGSQSELKYRVISGITYSFN